MKRNIKDIMQGNFPNEDKPMTYNTCTKCGYTRNSISRFCPNCGKDTLEKA